MTSYDIHDSCDRAHESAHRGVEWWPCDMMGGVVWFCDLCTRECMPWSVASCIGLYYYICPVCLINGSENWWLAVFTALHVMQTRYSDENSVRPSVCLSVTRVNCDKTGERSVQIFIPYERSFSLVHWEEEWLVGGATPSTWNFGSTGPRWSEIADSEHSS